MTALSYDVDEARCIATVNYYAPPSFPEWRRVLGRLTTHAAFQPHFGVLFDRSRVYALADASELNQMVRILDEERSNGRIAGRCAIVVHDAASYEIGKMAEQISSYENSIRTFHRLDDAERWATEKEAEPQNEAAAPGIELDAPAAAIG